mmetsp:Transcript_39550/g.88522  ORF Transcript_39550/g.88522 Transcript_39550/m.88522 type:complete len:166 (+) Transcript_39550:1-498(+)
MDAAVFDVKAVLNFQIGLAAPFLGPLVDLVAFFGYEFSKWFAGADIGLYNPTALLAGSTGPVRHVMVAHGFDDRMVLPRQSEDFAVFLEAQGAAFNVSTIFEHYTCGEKFPFPNHCQMHTWRPQMYREKLCHFWTTAFKMSRESCGLHALPAFPDCPDAVCVGPP